MSILAQFEGVEDLFETELISKGYFAPRPEGVMVNYLFVMESILDGEIFIAGAAIAEFIWDRLTEYAEYPAEIDGNVYLGGVCCHEIITEMLADLEEYPEQAVDDAYVGGQPVHEILTEYLGG